MGVGYSSKNIKKIITISLLMFFVFISIIFTTYLGFFQQKSVSSHAIIIPNLDLDKTTNSSPEFSEGFGVGSSSSRGSSSGGGGGGSSSSHSSSNNNNLNTEKVPQNNLSFTNDSILKNLTNDKRDYIPVIVMLKDQIAEITNKNDLSKARLIINSQEDKVLSEFNKSEFLLKHKYNTINGFTGKIKKESLEELRQNPNVKAVYEDRLLNVTLMDSVPLINADDVWNLGITGNGSVVCVVDTGIDYTHSDLGACNPFNLTGNIILYSLESPHPYTDNYDYTWTITQPGFSQIAVHFLNISVEYYWDYVYIMNASNNIVQSFTGYYTDVWSVSIPGDTIKIRLVTDYSITDWGFAVDKVLNGTITFLGLQDCKKVINGYDFVNLDNDPMDDNGHGTHVSGIVAANGTLKGVAPDAKLLAIKVCDAVGGCWGSDMIAGVDWCNNKSGTYNIVATTMSIGDGGSYNRTTCPTLMDDVINTAHDLGISVTVASGNEGYSNGISYPACSPNAISVGSTTKSDIISWFTNTGSLLDVLAPGSSIYSTIPGGYDYLSGTSMATPHVAGVIALLKQYSPFISPDRIRTVLKTTGIPIYDSRNGLTFPRIDALAALRNISNVACFSNSNCGTDYSFGSQFCQSDNVYKNWVVYTCNNPGTNSSYCSDSTAPKLKEECEYGCTDGRCKIKVCNYGKCYYV